MKTTATEEQIKNIIAAISSIYIYPFRQESGDPKYNAQRNLSGRTHYVDDDTLRFHKSRICSTSHLCGGLLFRVTCSDALDMHNTKRGFRSVVFDVFGTTVSRPSLENAHKTSAQAIKASQNEELDLVAHYRAALQEKLKLAAADAAKIETALAKIV